MSMMLVFLKRNDNSMNVYNDDDYQASLIRILLKMASTRYFGKVLKELLRVLKK